MGAIDKEKFQKFASDNNLEIKEYKINNLKQNEIFSVKSGIAKCFTKNTCFFVRFISFYILYAPGRP